MLESMQESLPIDVLVVSWRRAYTEVGAQLLTIFDIRRARRTSRFDPLTPTRERSYSVSSTSTPTPNSVCAQATTRPMKTW